MSGFMASSVYRGVSVPVPANGEWIDFFVSKPRERYCVYWRLSDGDRSDPDAVDYGFISAHRRHDLASAKAVWLTREFGAQA